MATKNREATITFNANVQQFNLGLKQVKSELSGLNSELKLNASNMKSSGASVEQLESKQELLKNKLSKSREEQILLSKKIEEATRIYGPNHEQVTILTNQLNNAKVAENKLNDEIKQTNQQLQAQKSAAGDTAQKVAGLDQKIADYNNKLDINSLKTEGVTYKHGLLGERLNTLVKQSKESAEKVNTLSEALSKCEQESGKNSEEYHRLEDALNKAKKEFLEIQGEVRTTANDFSDAERRIGTFSETMGNIGSKLKYISIGAAGLLGETAKYAIEFEDSFATVMKTVDEVVDSNGKVTYSYEQLKQEIRDLAKELPSSTTEISNVAAAAGQLGVATGDVMGFTETAIKMGMSTNLAAEDSAVAMAKFSNITQMTKKSGEDASVTYNRLGSVLVGLGNNYATTEADIMNMANNLAAAGTQVGMSESDILALAASLSSVGLESQAGGTAFSKTMIQMQLASEKGKDAYAKIREEAAKSNVTLDEAQSAFDKGGKSAKAMAEKIGMSSSEFSAMMKEAQTSEENLKNFADVAGMTGEQFAQAFKEDATGALSAFITGLSQMGGESESAIKVLDDMGITEIRMRDALLRSANASDVFTGAIKMGSDAWKENNALNQEADKRTQTTASQIEIMKNQLKDAGISMGTSFLPLIKDGVKWIQGLADKIADMDPKTLKMIAGLLGVVAVSAPVASGISKVSGAVKIGVDLYDKFSAALKVNESVSKAGSIGLEGLAGSMSALPVAAAVAGIGLVVAAAIIFADQMTKNIEKTYALTDAQKEQIDQNNKLVESLNQKQQSHADAIASIDREFDGYERLKGELASITDENGKVKAGYEERAQVITNQLGTALGIEIEYQDGVIQKYDEIMGKIDEVIVKKKTEAMITAMQSDMAQAYKDSSQAVSAYNSNLDILNQKNIDLATAQAKKDEAQRNYDKALKDGVQNIGEYQGRLQTAQTALNGATWAQKEAQTAFDDSKTTLQNLSNEIDNYDNLLDASASGNIDLMNSSMAQLQAGFTSFTEEQLRNSSENQKALFEQTDGFVRNLKLAQEESGLVSESVYQDFTRVTADSLTEFSKIPGGFKQAIYKMGSEGSTEIVKAIAQANIDGKLDESSKKAVKSFLGGFAALPDKSKEAFSKAWYGALQGLEGYEKLADPAEQGVEAFITSLESTLEVASPSRRVQRIFGQVWPGATNGLKEGQDGVYGTGDEVLSKFIDKLDDGTVTSAAQSAGVKMMEFFGSGIGSMYQKTQDRGKLNAHEANVGLGLIDPTPSGSKFASMFELGIGSMSKSNKDRGMANATDANTGLSLVNPTPTGANFGSIFGGGISSMSAIIQKTGENVASGANVGAGSISPRDTGVTFTNEYKKGVSSVSTKEDGEDRSRNVLTGMSLGDAVGVGANLTRAFAYGIRSIHVPVPVWHVSGGTSPYGIGGEGTAPSVSVSWAAKGGILNAATLLGMMGNGTLLGAGEAGPEAILPIEKLREYIRDSMERVMISTTRPENIDYDKLAGAIAKQPIQIIYKDREVGRMVRGYT